MSPDRRPIRRASSRLGAAALDRSRSLDGNLPVAFSRRDIGGPQRVASIREEGGGEGPAEDPDALAAEVAAWCAATPALAAVLGPGPATAAPLTGGLCNDVWVVSGVGAGAGAQVLVKRAQGFVRAAATVPLAVERQATEAAGLAAGHAAAPDAFPRVLALDTGRRLLATEFLAGRRSLSEALVRGDVFPRMAPQLGAALGRLAAATAPAALGPRAAAALAATLAGSASAVATMRDYCFVFPFDPACALNDWPDVLGAEVAARVHGDAALLAEVAALRAAHDAPGAAACLVHRDVWSGNVLCADDTTHVIDMEFGGPGPAAYDIGHALAHLVLLAFIARAHAEADDAAAGGAGGGAVPAARRRAQEAWLLGAVGEAHAAFADALAAAAPGGAPAAPLADVLGFAGVTMLRWSLGQFCLPEHLGIERNSPEFVAATARAVRVGAAAITGRHAMRSAGALAELARAELAGQPAKAPGRRWCCGL